MAIFGPACPDEPFRNNAIMWNFDDRALAMGFADTAQLIVDHWVDRGPNDALFVPLVYNCRHALELVLKAAIREAAARLPDGRIDKALEQDRVDEWLADEAVHNLHKLAFRLDRMLAELGLDTLPSDTNRVLLEIHGLDPNGQSFRYAQVRKGKDAPFEDAPLPLVKDGNYGANVDVVAMHKHFDEAFTLISDGLMSVLGQYAEYQRDMADWQ
ncbi:hypothetical protein [Candidatus Poriferisodalis sp.]|uniref:hypothetical protein n=1 Tax=Candidatus Poriferisodalis sp. TaxID=3101277 RepID=UPI003D09F985